MCLFVAFFLDKRKNSQGRQIPDDSRSDRVLHTGAQSETSAK